MSLQVRGLNQAIEQASARNDGSGDKLEVLKNGTLFFTLESDGVMKFSTGLWIVPLDVAITANVTTTSAPAGSFGFTSHATGRGKVFYSDGAKWQFGAIT